MNQETTFGNKFTVVEVVNSLLTCNTILGATNCVANIEIKRAIILAASQLQSAIIDNSGNIEELPVYNDDPMFRIYHFTRTSFQETLTDAADWLMIAACTEDLTTLSAEVSLCMKRTCEIINKLLGQE